MVLVCALRAGIHSVPESHGSSHNFVPEAKSWRSFVWLFALCAKCSVYSYLPFHHYGHVVICCWESEFLTRTHRAETSFSCAADSFFRDCAMCVQYSVLLAFIIASDKLVCLRAEWIRVCEWRAASRWHKRHTKNTKIRKLVMRRKLVSCGKTNKMECYNSYERRRCL